MFPTGTPGAALCILRISVAASMLLEGANKRSGITLFWAVTLFLLPSIFLCIGFLTPYCSVLSLLLLLTDLPLRAGQDGFRFAQSIVICGVLAVLGPGAYSLDAHLFGRKLLEVPRRKP